MKARTIMIQGTASSVGKSILVAAFCRIFKQDGYSVAPFKAQNMSNNSFVTTEGGEIGRAQAVQAEASCIPPSVLMNPVLLKPEADNKSQIIVLGKVDRTVDARNYYRYTDRLLNVVKESLDTLRKNHDIIVIEGAGSPAEINLKDREIVNMRVAKMVKAPVLLAGDIDRGGVFASLLGTLQLLDDMERELIKGLIINKFRGDISLLKTGLDMLEKRTGLPVLGVVPYFTNISIAQEDAVFLNQTGKRIRNNELNIAIIYLPHISNYDDFDPLGELDCNLIFVKEPKQLENADLIIIPGTKSTIEDLNYIKRRGIDQVILMKARSGIPVMGICGGYQMLGKTIIDPDKVESRRVSTRGLGLLNIETTFLKVKTTTQVRAQISANIGLLAGLKGINVEGYEIHMGNTDIKGYQHLSQIQERYQGKSIHLDGIINEHGNIMGTYIHGIFHNKEFTRSIVNRLRLMKGLPATDKQMLNKEEEYDKLASTVRSNINMIKIYSILKGKLTW